MERQDGLTLNDVARLAAVQRPVVSNWRRRFAGTAKAFPAALSNSNGATLFDATEVVQWLDATGHGLNPRAGQDVAAHVSSALADSSGVDNFEALTSLLALARFHSGSLGDLQPDELLDIAESVDPDDEFLLSELALVQDQLQGLASRVDALVEADYDATSAFERLLQRQRQSNKSSPSPAQLATSLIRIASNLIGSHLETASDLPTVVDSQSDSGDILIALSEQVGEVSELPIALPAGDMPQVRLTRRRLQVNGRYASSLEIDKSGEFSFAGPAVHLAQFSSNGNPGLDGEPILRRIDQILLQAEDSHRGLIIGPASVLADALTIPELDSERSSLLRGGRVRAVVRLPSGLVPSRPRSHQCVWVFGPPLANTNLEDQWFLGADIASVELSERVITELVQDLHAAIGSDFDRKAHSFALMRPTLTRTVLAKGGPLVVAKSRIRKVSRSDVVATIELDELFQSEFIGENDAAKLTPSWSLDVSDQRSETHGRVTIGEALQRRHLRYLPGTRLETSELDSAGGVEIIGVDELVGESPIGFRRVDRFNFAFVHPTARLTEPGDIVFSSSPTAAAIVDRVGSRVVMYPARVLRIDRQDAGGLVPTAVAVDIRASRPSLAWRHWLVRVVPPGQRALLESALTDVEGRRESLLARASRLDEFSSRLVYGVAIGAATLSDRSEKEN